MYYFSNNFYILIFILRKFNFLDNLYIKMRKKKSNKSKKYKIMKGGSFAGNFLRFLAEQNKEDNMNVNELKELDQYKKERKRKDEEERLRKINEKDNYLYQQQEAERKAYANTVDIIDGNKELQENQNLNVLKGGGELLRAVNREQHENFNNWYKGSYDALKNLKENNNYSDDTLKWKRENAGGLFFHTQVTKGGRRKRRKSRKQKKRRKSKRKSRKRKIKRTKRKSRKRRK